jgi:gliding motility-associated-like protein
VASAMAQNGIVIYEGDQKAYRVTDHSGSSYLWTIYNDPVFKNKVSGAEVKIVSAENNSSLVVNWLKSGMYYVSLVETDQSGCTNTKALAVNVYPVSSDKPTARIAGPPIVTLGGCNTRGHIIDASGSVGEGLSFAWSPTAYLDNPTSSKPLFIVGKTTRYHLTVTDSRGQKDTTSVLIYVADSPKAVTDHNVFVKSSATSIVLDGSKSTGTGLTYLWQSTDGIISNGETTPVGEVKGLGKYYLKVTDSFGCTSRDSVEVGLYTQAIKDTSETKLNFAVDINVLANDIPKGKLNPSTLRIVTAPKNGMASIVGDSLISYQPNQYFVGSDDFVYSICDYSQHCDQATVLVLVNDLPFFIPEAFSPNGDGINDEFVINGLAKYKTVEITIFNRWGNTVYKSNNYGETKGRSGFWNGTASQGLRFGNGPVPTGTYFYVLVLDGKQKINGSVYLDR